MNPSQQFGRAAGCVAAVVGLTSALTLLNDGYLGAQNRFPFFLSYKVLSTKGALIAIGIALLAVVGVIIGQRLMVAASAVGFAVVALIVLFTWRETAGQPGSNPLDNALGAGGPALCMFLGAAIGLGVLSWADHVS